MFAAGAKQEPRQLLLKRPKLHDGFQGKVLKDQIKGAVLWGVCSAHEQSSD